MTPDTLTRLAQLEKQATAGEWQAAYGELIVPKRDKRGRPTGKSLTDIIAIEYDHCECDTPCRCTGTLQARTEDLLFIAAMRNALPDLLDAARRLEALRGRQWALLDAALYLRELNYQCTAAELDTIRALLDAPASPGREREGTTHG